MRRIFFLVYVRFSIKRFFFSVWRKVWRKRKKGVKQRTPQGRRPISEVQEFPMGASLCCCRRGKAQFEDGYPVIKINDREENRVHLFGDNYIRTTKYTPLTFLPKNLFEQFRRTTNFYFLLIVIITFIPSISPLQPWTAVLPLVFVLFVSALKEGYEDFVRYKSDRRVNNAVYTRLINGEEEEEIRSLNVQVGDLIKIKDDQPFPADICLLWTSGEGGVAYVETSSLDGETNLKTFLVRPEILDLPLETIRQWNSATFTAETPAHHLYSFTGKMQVEEEEISISQEQLLLRGASLRNTGEAVGVVVYVGAHTKLSLNAKPPPSKFSTTDRILNKVVVVLFVFQTMLCLMAGLFSTGYQSSTGRKSFYLDFNDSSLWVGTKSFFSYFALMSFLIPMSLMVTLEVVKVFQSKFMEWDMHMASDPRDVAHTGMRAKTSNLNDELALIKYVFSDKTGTLTENIMRFRKSCINYGKCFDSAFEGEIGKFYLDSPNDEDPIQKNAKDFLVCLAVAHGANVEVVGEEEDQEVVYTSASPDEEALCQGAAINGAIFLRRTQEEMVVELFGERTIFKILHVFDFSSTRARMSVIARDPDGVIKVLTKGADAKVIPRLWEGEPRENIDEINERLLEYSKEGLRTLLLAERVLQEDEYKNWLEIWHAASVAMEDRDSKVEEAMELMEKDLRLLGCTAIEDKLQENVPETIDYLLQAGVRFWMITGDKQETAINIGNSCKLLNEDMELIIINCPTEEECLRLIQEGLQLIERNKDGGSPVGLVVNGGSLDWALENVDSFLDLALYCQSVIICRASPLQKAKVVKFIKEGERAITLSIGDGANDVSMIQEAHVGVGIFGREGSQAARNADYAIREFQHLKRLMVVHGRYSLIRNSSLILYSFYKNAAFFLPQFWFGFFSGFSGMTMYEDFIVTLFNIVFTSIPPFFIALFDKDIKEDSLMKYPQLYIPVQKNPYLTHITVAFWLLSAVWHSFVVFCTVTWALQLGVVYSNGQVAGLSVYGNLMAISLMWIISFKISLETLLWNIPVTIGIIGSLLSFLVVVLLESVMPSWFPGQYGIVGNLMRMLGAWALVLLLIVVCIWPELFFRAWGRYFHPQDWEILQEMESMNRTKYHELEEEEVDERLSSPQFPSGPEKGLRESGPRTRATLRHTYTIDDGDERKSRQSWGSGGYRDSFLHYAEETDLRVTAAHERRYTVAHLREDDDMEE